MSLHLQSCHCAAHMSPWKTAKDTLFLLWTQITQRPLRASVSEQQINNTEGVNCRLQVAGAGCRLQVAGCRCRCRLQVAGCDYIFFKQKMYDLYIFKQKMYDLYMVRFYLNFFKKIRIVSFVKKPW